MTDELGRQLSARVEAATPAALPAYDDVLARRRVRRVRRRVGGTLAAVAAIGAVGSAAALATGPSGERGDPPIATPTTALTTAPLRFPVGRADQPPVIIARGDGEQHGAWQGSYCWRGGCADMIVPSWDELPDLGPAATVEAGTADGAATWSVSLAGERRCARYPVLLTSTGAGTYRLTPAGPAGDYRLDAFLQLREGGDTSGAFRWTTPGPSAATSWTHLHQDTPTSGGEGDVQVVLEGAAVDGEVSGTMTVSGSDRSRTFELVVLDQGCPGDRYVTLAPRGQIDRAVDGLGRGPFTYDVDLVVDGTHHHATATSAGRAEDTRLTFEPALPE